MIRMFMKTQKSCNLIFFKNVIQMSHLFLNFKDAALNDALFLKLCIRYRYSSMKNEEENFEKFILFISLHKDGNSISF